MYTKLIAMVIDATITRSFMLANKLETVTRTNFEVTSTVH